MTRIKQTENIHPGYIVAAKCHHQARGNSRIRVPRMYMAADHRDGSGMREFLLTRYVNQLDVPMSCILQVEKAGGHNILHEVCRAERKHEEEMVITWSTKEGGDGCGPECLL